MMYPWSRPAERCDTMLAIPTLVAVAIAPRVCETVPIWFGLISCRVRQLLLAASRIRLWVGHVEVVADDLDPVSERRLHAAEPSWSSSANRLSMLRIGYASTRCR